MLGERLVVCGAAHDISQRIQAQESLRLAHRTLITAREEERRRLSRELHDSIGQQLVAAGLKIRALETEMQGAPDSTTSLRLDELLRQHRELSEEVRRVSRALYPQVLEEFGLAASLRQLTSDMASSETAVWVDTDESLEAARFDREVEIALYRIAQEALTNALRHARCSEVKIQLRRHEDELALSITDNGIGFDAAGVNQGQGLVSMRERADAISAKLDIASGPGQTCVSVQVAAEPLPMDDRGSAD
jgi:signal transduction histidine kinase